MMISAPIPSLSAAELEAVFALWRGERHKIVTSFDGTSMLPAIAPEQQVTVECGAKPAVGEVIVFQLGGQVGVHRLVARTAAWLMTWGDANSLPDIPIDPARVVGVVRDVPPARRSLRRALLLRFLASHDTQAEALANRVRRLHGARAAWRRGPLFFAAKALRAFLH